MCQEREGGREGDRYICVALGIGLKWMIGSGCCEGGWTTARTLREKGVDRCEGGKGTGVVGRREAEQRTKWRRKMGRGEEEVKEEVWAVWKEDFGIGSGAPEGQTRLGSRTEVQNGRNERRRVPKRQPRPACGNKIRKERPKTTHDQLGAHGKKLRTKPLWPTAHGKIEPWPSRLPLWAPIV